MPIETDFSFAQVIPKKADAEERLVAPVDLLGPLRRMVGPKPTDPRQDAQRKWKGHGFNLIWRPNFPFESDDKPFGDKQFFLQLNLTEEELDFTEITGTGIANRSLFESTIALGAIAYTQSIKDSFDHSGQHFEPGVWAHVPETAHPKVQSTVVRMGSIPHGTTINLQGTATRATKPIFEPASITPFLDKDDGTHLFEIRDEEDLNRPSHSRTERKRLAGLTPQHLKNPNLFLSDALAKQTVLSTTVLSLTSSTTSRSIPDAGGGTSNIASLAGGRTLNGSSNALATVVTTTFWIEHVRDEDGAEFEQMQYTQRVLLRFSRLNWPHITVATLRPVQSDGP
jgi:hypothetical protein